MLPHYIRLAYECYDKLVKTGGRPTRKLLEELDWKDVNEKGQISIFGELHSAVGLKATVYHWTHEWTLFQEESDRWTEFKEYQPKMKKEPLLKITFDPATTDHRLMEILIKMNDWREFQNYQQEKVGRAASQTRRYARHLERMVSEEIVSDAVISKFEPHEEWHSCLEYFYHRHRNFEESKKQLTWIESQVPEILAEACDSLKYHDSLQQQLELRLKQQVNALHQVLPHISPEPYHTVILPPDRASFTQKILHWGSEITRLMEEHWEWKHFLKWQGNQQCTEESAINEDQESSRRSTDFQVRADLVCYRKYQFKKAREFVVGWHWVQKDWEKKRAFSQSDRLPMLKTTDPESEGYMKKLQRDLRIAEIRVQSAEQTLAEQYSDPDTVHVSTRHPKSPGSPLRTQSPGIGPEKCAIKPSVELFEISTKAITDAEMADEATAAHDTRATNVLDSLRLHEVNGEDKGGDPRGNFSGSVEDTMMGDVELHVDSIPHSVPRNGCNGDARARKKKTRTTTKLDRTISGTIPKNIGKKPIKSTRPFTEKQNTALLNAASVNCAPADS